MALLNIDANAKTVKGQALGYMTGIMYLAPANLSGFEVCAYRSAGCSAACLNTAGRGRFTSTQEARIKKTKALFADRAAFIATLNKEIKALVKKAAKKGFTPCVRLNGTSDLDWTDVINQHPDVQFYDYSKHPIRFSNYLEGKLPKNYHLTFSLSETNKAIAFEFLKRGGNVAAVFAVNDPALFPETYHGFKVVSGDESDLRFLDEKGVIVALKMKGKAKKDESGFTLKAA